jgi:hypothetical protein
MANFVPVSKDTHGSKRWISKGRYDFAKTMAVVPIAAEETLHATREMPCAFTKVEDRFVLSVVLGLQPDTNLFVIPDGRWIGSYTPALFRAYPFRLAKVQGQENLALVVDEDGGLSSDGEPFFDEEGKPAPKLAQFIEFLTKIEQGRRKTDEVVKQLDDAGLIEEWPITIKGDDGSEQKINGLYRVAEQKLNQLDDESFLKLRRSQALPLAYMQLLSMRNIDILGKLAKAQIEVAQKQADQAAKLFYGDQDDELKIDWSQFETKE